MGARPPSARTLARRLGTAGAGLVVVAAAVAAVHVTPALLDRRVAAAPGPAPAWLDLCAERRPDGTLPGACGGAAFEVTLLFAGDTAAIDGALPVLAERGFDFPFASTRALLSLADLAVVNVEAPITAGEHGFAWGKQYLYRAPPELARELGRAGVDVAGLANNHVTDHGAAGLGDTLAHLGAQGVAALGAGADEASARRGLVVRLGPLRVGLLSRCERKLDWDLWVRQYAAGAHPGVAALDEQVLADVARLRGDSDLVVVLVHWGEGYAPITATQRRWAARLAAAGADLVIGHHPHRVQPLALLPGPGGRPVPVAFSLGNYAFGTAGRPDLDLGLLLRARVRGRRLARLELLPLDVQNRRVGYRPEPLAGAAAAAALTPLVLASGPLGADLRLEDAAAVLDLPPGPGAPELR